MVCCDGITGVVVGGAASVALFARGDSALELPSVELSPQCLQLLPQFVDLLDQRHVLLHAAQRNKA